MLLVAALAVIFWRWKSGVQLRWFCVGAGLWTAAVILKVICAFQINSIAIGFLKDKLGGPFFIVEGGLFLGIESAVFEIGLTWLAVRIWPQLGRDAGRAIAIGAGAGAFEAFLLGLAVLVAASTAIAGVVDAEGIGEGMEAAVAATSLFWLVGPTERMIALLGHTSTRALILLGVAKHKPGMVFWGFTMFTLIDGIAGAFLLSGSRGSRSQWWLELAVMPFAVVSVPILMSCWRHWRIPLAEASEAS